VRWYLRYSLSYRDLEEMMLERGLSVDHTTIYRLPFKPMHQNWKNAADRTCMPVMIPGEWMRRTSKSKKCGCTSIGLWIPKGTRLPFLLSPTRDAEAAKRFFLKALQPSTRSTSGACPMHKTASSLPSSPLVQEPAPRVINTDKNAAYPKAIAELKAAGLLPQQVELRQVKYLNNLIEQDHRFIKRLTKPGMGFFSFETAWRTLQGFEVMNMIRKGQVQGVGKGDVKGQVALVAKLFGVAA